MTVFIATLNVAEGKEADFERLQTENAQIPPEPLTDMENALIDIWKEALGL